MTFPDDMDNRVRGEDFPHPAGRLPLVGDLFTVRRSEIMVDLLRHFENCGDSFELKFFSSTARFTRDIDWCGTLLDDRISEKCVTAAVRELRLWVGDALFTSDSENDTWHRDRSTLARGFDSTAMRSYHSTIRDNCNLLVDGWVRSGKAENVPADMTKLTLETISNCGFGYSTGAIVKYGEHPFVPSMVQMLKRARFRALVDGFPAAKRVEEVWHSGSRDNSRPMVSLIDEIVRNRVSVLDRPGGDQGYPDLLSRMLSEYVDNRTGVLPQVDAEHIRHTVLTLLVAGHETTAGALSFALYYMARHPEVQSTIFSEVSRYVSPESDIDYDSVARLRFTRHVVEESLRLWPTVPAVARRYRGTDEHPVIVSLLGLHRNPKLWGTDADEFVPERFDSLDRAQKSAYKPFGVGARSCIGRQFALHEAVVAIAVIVRRCEIRNRTGSVAHPHVRDRLTLMPSPFEVLVDRR